MIYQYIFLIITVVSVGFVLEAVSLMEDDTDFLICINKNRDTVRPVTVNISATSGSATAGVGMLKCT